jgi:hypothetical protein
LPALLSCFEKNKEKEEKQGLLEPKRKKNSRMKVGEKE